MASGISLARQPESAINPSLMLRENFLVDARLVIITLEMRGRGELDQILVAGFIFRQQHEMIVNIASAAAGTFFSSRLPGAT